VTVKKKVPKYFADAPSDCKMAEVPVQEDFPISDTTPIPKSIINGDYGVQPDCKKPVPFIEGHSPFSEPTKIKGIDGRRSAVCYESDRSLICEGVKDKENKNRGPK
jgi:hypothetical protein